MHSWLHHGSRPCGLSKLADTASRLRRVLGRQEADFRLRPRGRDLSKRRWGTLDVALLLSGPAVVAAAITDAANVVGACRNESLRDLPAASGDRELLLVLDNGKPWPTRSAGSS